MPETAATELLEELTALKTETRRQRHAYWLPLGLFGVLIAASSPLYVQVDVLCGGRECPPYGVLQPIDWQWLNGFGGGVRGIYWLFVLLTGALVTFAWYAWYGRVSGITTRVAGPVGAWAVGAAMATSTLGLAGLGSVLFGYVLPGRGYFPLLVIGLGLLTLSALERSWMMAVTSVFTIGWAIIASILNPENVYLWLLEAAGVPDSRTYQLVTVGNVLVPGAVLFVVAACAFLTDLRRR